MEARTMKNSIKWIVLGFLLTVIFLMTMMRSPEEIFEMLRHVTVQVKIFSVFTHIMFLAVIAVGLTLSKTRAILFSLFIAFLALSATIISIKYMILPNIIIFGMFFVLILNAYLRRQLNFELKNQKPINPGLKVLCA